MKMIVLLCFILTASSAFADTPPSGVVKSRTFSGDGNTSVSTTGTSLNVNVTNPGGGTQTVNQGTAGVSAWLASISSSALPTNACQETGGHLASIDTKLTSPLAVTGSFFQATQPVSGTLTCNAGTGTQAVSAASLPLPSGAATAAKQPALGTAGTPASDVITVQGATSMTALKVDGSAVTQPVSGSVSVSNFPSSQTVTGSVSVTNLPATQPVSGTVSISGTVPVSASALPLPSGASTAAKQPALGTAGTPASDVLTVQGATSMTALKVDGSAVTQPVSGTVSVSNFPATQAVSAASLPLPAGAATAAKQPSIGTAGTASADVLTVQGAASMTALKVDGSAVTQPVSAASLPLPAGAATSANQATEISSLATIATNTASNPADSSTTGTLTAVAQTVVLTAAPGSSSWSLQLSGTFSAGTNIAWEVTDNGTDWIGVNGRQTGSGNGTSILVNNTNGPGPLTFRGNLAGTLQFRARCTTFQSGDSVSVAIRASTGTGAVFLNSAIPGGINVIGKVGIDQTTPGTTNGVVVNSSALATGAATSANQATEITALNAIDAGIPTALGQTTASASMPVTIASDQSAVQVSQPDLFITGQGTQTVTGNNIVLAVAGTGNSDVAGYRSGSVQVVSTGTGGTFIFENSNDGTNFTTMIVYNSALVTATPITAAITATASSIIYTFPIRARYIRVRIASTITGGSLQAVSRISQESWSPAVMSIAQPTAASLNTTSTVSGNLTTVATVSTITSDNLAAPGIIADVASAAITTTTTTATLTPTNGVGYKVQIPVTVVSGTTPTMAVQVQESADTGTNWVTVYTFPTISATGSYESPPLFFKGNRVRYVQTIAGTTPSFTRAINRLQMSAVAAAPVNNNATFASAAVSAVTTLTAPANAIGFVLQNLNTNTTNLRYAIGATASSTNGMQLEPGRDTGEIHAGQNLSICPESGTITYSIQWVQQ